MRAKAEIPVGSSFRSHDINRTLHFLRQSLDLKIDRAQLGHGQLSCLTLNATKQRLASHVD